MTSKILDHRCLRRFSADDAVFVPEKKMHYSSPDSSTLLHQGGAGEQEEEENSLYQKKHGSVAPLLFDPQQAWHVSLVVNVDLPGLRWSDPYSTGRWQRWLLRALPEMHSMTRLDLRDGKMGDLWCRALIDVLIQQRLSGTAARRNCYAANNNKNLTITTTTTAASASRSSASSSRAVSVASSSNKSEQQEESFYESSVAPLIVIHLENNNLTQASAQQIGRFISTTATNGGGYHLELHLRDNPKLGDHGAQMLAAHASKAAALGGGTTTTTSTGSSSSSSSLKDISSRVVMKYLDVSGCDVGGRGLSDLLVNCGTFCRAVFTEGQQYYDERYRRRLLLASNENQAQQGEVEGKRLTSISPEGINSESNTNKQHNTHIGGGSTSRANSKSLGRASSVASSTTATTSRAVSIPKSSNNNNFHTKSKSSKQQQQQQQPSIFSREAMRNIPANCSLRVIDFSGNIKMSSSSLSVLIPAILVCCPNLRALGMAECFPSSTSVSSNTNNNSGGAQILRSFIDALTSLCRSCQTCPALEFFDVSGNNNIPDQIILKLIEFLNRDAQKTKLKVIDVSNGEQLSDDDKLKKPVLVQEQTQVFVRSSLGRDVWRSIMFAASVGDDSALEVLASQDPQHGDEIQQYVSNIVHSPSASVRRRHHHHHRSSQGGSRSRSAPAAVSPSPSRGGETDNRLLRTSSSPSASASAAAAAASTSSSSSPPGKDKSDNNIIQQQQEQESLIASPIPSGSNQQQQITTGTNNASATNDSAIESMFSDLKQQKNNTDNKSSKNDLGSQDLRREGHQSNKNKNKIGGQTNKSDDDDDDDDYHSSSSSTSSPSPSPTKRVLDFGEKETNKTTTATTSLGGTTTATATTNLELETPVDASDIASEASDLLQKFERQSTKTTTNPAHPMRSFTISVNHEPVDTLLCVLVPLVAGGVPTSDFFTQLFMADLQEWIHQKQRKGGDGDDSEDVPENQRVIVEKLHIFYDGTFAINAKTCARRIVADQLVRSAFGASGSSPKTSSPLSLRSSSSAFDSYESVNAAFPRLHRVISDIVIRQRLLSEFEGNIDNVDNNSNRHNNSGGSNSNSSNKHVVTISTSPTTTLDVPAIARCIRHKFVEFDLAILPPTTTTTKQQQQVEEKIANASRSNSNQTNNTSRTSSVSAQHQDQQQHQVHSGEEQQKEEEENVVGKTPPEISVIPPSSTSTSVNASSVAAAAAATTDDQEQQQKDGEDSKSKSRGIIQIDSSDEDKKAASEKKSSTTTKEKEESEKKTADIVDATASPSSPPPPPPPVPTEEEGKKDEKEENRSESPSSPPPPPPPVVDTEKQEEGLTKEEQEKLEKQQQEKESSKKIVDVFAFEQLAKKVQSLSKLKNASSPVTEQQTSASASAAAAASSTSSRDIFLPPVNSGIPRQTETSVITPPLRTQQQRKRISTMFESVIQDTLGKNGGIVHLSESKRNKRRLFSGTMTEVTDDGIDREAGESPYLEKLDVVVNLEWDDFIVIKSCHSAWIGVTRILRDMQPVLGNSLAAPYLNNTDIALARPGGDNSIVLCFAAYRGAGIRTHTIHLDVEGFGEEWREESEMKQQINTNNETTEKSEAENPVLKALRRLELAVAISCNSTVAWRSGM